MYTFRIHGARGSVPASGPSYLRYGGHTTCFSLETEDGLIVVDAGSGLTDLDRLLRDRPAPPRLTLLFTHFHLDHIMGLAALTALHRAESKVVLMAVPEVHESWMEAPSSLLAQPFWPVSLLESRAYVDFQDFPAGGRLNLHGVVITWCRLVHPQASVAYRLDTPCGSVVVATDHEPGCPEADARLIRWAEGADLFLSDAQFSPEEAVACQGWGHGSWKSAAELAERAGVHRLLLTHHHPTRADEELDRFVHRARDIFPSPDAAAEHQQVDLWGGNGHGVLHECGIHPEKPGHIHLPHYTH
jgi:phosphoribosyl 1,2-cyclic phosphodiesterase